MLVSVRLILLRLFKDNCQLLAGVVPINWWGIKRLFQLPVGS
jgi:hypothetical protein